MKPVVGKKALKGARSPAKAKPKATFSAKTVKVSGGKSKPLSAARLLASLDLSAGEILEVKNALSPYVDIKKAKSLKTYKHSGTDKKSGSPLVVRERGRTKKVVPKKPK
jgi:hypothetical protein